MCQGMIWHDLLRQRIMKVYITAGYNVAVQVLWQGILWDGELQKRCITLV